MYGLYGSFIPVIVYSFLGTSRHISVGECFILVMSSFLFITLGQWYLIFLPNLSNHIQLKAFVDKTSQVNEKEAFCK